MLTPAEAIDATQMLQLWVNEMLGSSSEDPKMIDEAVAAWTELYDCVATQDWANCAAMSDVRVGDNTLISDVPVTHLLFLEKRIDDVLAFINKLPTLDPAKDWEGDPNSACFKSKPVEKLRTVKTPQAFVKYEATPEHPAQVEMVHEDVVAGTWTAINFSGALPDVYPEFTVSWSYTPCAAESISIGDVVVWCSEEHGDLDLQECKQRYVRHIQERVCFLRGLGTIQLPEDPSSEEWYIKEVPAGVTKLGWCTSYNGTGWHWIGPDLKIGPLEFPDETIRDLAAPRRDPVGEPTA